MAHSFSISQNDFLLDDAPFKIISGALHYFRVVPAYWRDRLEKLKNMGCNTVETYVPWNLHEPQKGTFCFTGLCDIEGFIRLAGELGLHVIVRPGPYICAEWEFGGLPAWLLAEDGMRVRTLHEGFMGHLREYWQVLLPKLAPLQISQGGPVLCMQVENEYGYYGDSLAYMRAVGDLLRQNGITVPLVTSDGPDGDSLACGSVEGALATANFGSGAGPRFDKLQKHLATTGGGPLMCMEFWVGWFDAWGDAGHHTSDPGENAKDLEEMLARGSVNFYMYHGGTNFGFMNGSNYYDHLTPDTTSYDYDAPLAEDGSVTEKYKAFREVIGRHAQVAEVPLTTEIKTAGYGALAPEKSVPLLQLAKALPITAEADGPLCMEKLGQGYGYTLYSTQLTKGERVERLRLMGANDRAQVFVNGSLALTLYDRELDGECKVDWPVGGGLTLDILVENMGRVNFGPMMDHQRKGIDGAVLVNGHAHSGWQMRCLPFDPAFAENLPLAAHTPRTGPAVYSFTLAVDAPADTWVDMTGWGKGCVLVNGFNLGRFWQVGPQYKLYLPAPLLKEGQNSIVVLETEGVCPGTLSFVQSDH